LGMMYEEGDGVDKDVEKAVKLYRFAADQGHAMAQGSLGWMYINGNGVEEDLDEAAKWYRRSEQSRKAKNDRSPLSTLR
jgi:TPR repeat protein